jgi:hypothetical protein
MDTQFLFKEVFMKKKILKQRASAVQRYLAGEDPASICASLAQNDPMAVQVGSTTHLG